MAYGKDRERVDVWPKTGTKERLKRKAKKKNLSLAKYLVELLEQAAE